MEIQKIIAKAGGPVALARELGITHQAIGDWKKVPGTRVKQVAELTGLLPKTIRPDIF